jgi:cysteine-rich repeat protein
VSPSGRVHECGDGVTSLGEECDDGNENELDGCLSTCRRNRCGDQVVQSPEECDDGDENSDTRPHACRLDCRLWRCGDDVLDEGEECDLGDDNDDMAPDVCRTDCTRAHCGDGVIDSGEQCDDENDDPADGCASCVLTTCGDGEITGPEECDDGDREGGDGCGADCRLETPVCGDGLLQFPAEACDDGNDLVGDCCTDCTVEPGCEVEPNDLYAQANDFSLTAIDQTVRGFIDPSDDHDSFLVQVPLGEVVTIRAQTLDGPAGTTCLSFDLDTEVEVWRVVSAGEAHPIAYDDDDGPGFCSDARATGVGPGTYLVVVQAWTYAPAVFDYALKLSVTPVIRESETNDGAATADGPLAEDNYLHGSISPLGDQDFYRFDVPAHADLHLEIFDTRGPGNCDLLGTQLELRSADGSVVLAQDAAGGLGNCSRITWSTHPPARGLAPGTYTIRVADLGNDATIPGYVLFYRLDSVCGDNLIQASEICDDGNVMSGDTCSGTCR